VSCPSLRTVAPLPCFPLSIKDLLKKDGLSGWLLAACGGGCCCVSASLKTENLGVMLEISETWDSASLRTETLKNRKEERL
jgi:hypothetical protein